MKDRYDANGNDKPSELTRVSPMTPAMSEPLQYASGYSLDLYCDQPVPYSRRHTRQATYSGDNWADVARQAKADGWKIHKKTRTATCPICVKEPQQ